MAKYLVRKGFCVHKGEQKFPEGSELELNPDELDLVKHQVEPIVIPKEAKS